MPIYEYRCPKCGEFEFTQRITEPPLKKCPTCRSKVAKLISNTSFQLKGSGWYITDYARKSSPEPTSKAESSGDGKAGSTASEPKKSAESKKPAEPATTKSKNRN